MASLTAARSASGGSEPAAVHASWLNYVESYFSFVQRKVLSPNDFDSPRKLEAALLCFQERYEKIHHSVPMELHP